MDQQIGKVFPVRYSVGMISELDQLSFASDSDFHLLMKNKNWVSLAFGQFGFSKNYDQDFS